MLATEAPVNGGHNYNGPKFDWGGRLLKSNGGVQRQTSRTETKVGHSDLTLLCGKGVTQRIKVWHLDVGSSHPGAVVRPKGWAVRPLKRYVSWVQNVVRQFGPYPA
eukprot:gene19070-19422_t